MKTDSPGSVFWGRFRRNKLAVAGGIIVLFLFMIAALAPVVSPYKPNEIDRKYILTPPSLAHPFGTDDLGRDVLSRMIYGSKISLAVGFVSVGIATCIGLIIGAVAGYYGRWIERIAMRFIDIMLTIPTFFLILAVMAFMEPNLWFALL
jgi:peptide/nickel transport system permease protein